jgi:hypothetical protein
LLARAAPPDEDVAFGVRSHRHILALIHAEAVYPFGVSNQKRIDWWRDQRGYQRRVGGRRGPPIGALA